MLGELVVALDLMEHREDPCSKLKLQLFQNHKGCHHFCDVIVIISSFLSKIILKVISYFSRNFMSM
jgi:hypothetical protein